MRTIALSLFTASGLLLTGMQGHAQATDPGDGFDALYGKRIELFSKQLAIYESVVDQPGAEEAAKKWRALLPLEKEIKQLAEKLGQPNEERLAELDQPPFFLPPSGHHSHRRLLGRLSHEIAVIFP